MITTKCSNNSIRHHRKKFHMHQHNTTKKIIFSVLPRTLLHFITFFLLSCYEKRNKKKTHPTYCECRRKPNGIASQRPIKRALVPMFYVARLLRDRNEALANAEWKWYSCAQRRYQSTAYNPQRYTSSISAILILYVTMRTSCEHIFLCCCLDARVQRKAYKQIRVWGRDKQMRALSISISMHACIAAREPSDRPIHDESPEQEHKGVNSRTQRDECMQCLSFSIPTTDITPACALMLSCSIENRN